MKKLLIFIFFISSPLFAQTIQPLTNNSFERILENNETNHNILEGCVSLYSATEHTQPPLTEGISNIPGFHSQHSSWLVVEE